MVVDLGVMVVDEEVVAIAVGGEITVMVVTEIMPHGITTTTSGSSRTRVAMATLGRGRTTGRNIGVTRVIGGEETRVVEKMIY